MESRPHRACHKFLELAVKLLLSAQTVLLPPEFKFTNDMEAAASNWNSLVKKKFDCSSFERRLAIESFFEFNNITYLEMVIGNHPTWINLKKMTTNGAVYPLVPILEEDRVELLIFSIY